MTLHSDAVNDKCSETVKANRKAITYFIIAATNKKHHLRGDCMSRE